MRIFYACCELKCIFFDRGMAAGGRKSSRCQVVSEDEAFVFYKYVILCVKDILIIHCM